MPESNTAKNKCNSRDRGSRVQARAPGQRNSLAAKGVKPKGLFRGLSASSKRSGMSLSGSSTVALRSCKLVQERRTLGDRVSAKSIAAVRDACTEAYAQPRGSESGLRVEASSGSTSGSRGCTRDLERGDAGRKKRVQVEGCGSRGLRADTSAKFHQQLSLGGCGRQFEGLVECSEGSRIRVDQEQQLIWRGGAHPSNWNDLTTVLANCCTGGKRRKHS
eukprot:3343520-Rhodomonas_salina.2